MSMDSTWGSNITATLSTGQASVRKALDPQAGRDGWYAFDLILTRVGTYSVRLNGTLGTQAVDVSVKLDDVIPASDLAFPTSSDLEDRLNAANAVIAGLQTQLIVALVVGCVGVLVGAGGVLMGWRMLRTQRKAP